MKPQHWPCRHIVNIGKRDKPLMFYMGLKDSLGFYIPRSWTRCPICGAVKPKGKKVK